LVLQARATRYGAARRGCPAPCGAGACGRRSGDGARGVTTGNLGRRVDYACDRRPRPCSHKDAARGREQRFRPPVKGGTLVSYRAGGPETARGPETERMQGPPSKAPAGEEAPRFGSAPEPVAEPTEPDEYPEPQPDPTVSSGGLRDRIARAIQSFDPRRAGQS